MKAVIFNLTKVEINQCTMELALIYFISKQRQCKKKKKGTCEKTGHGKKKKEWKMGVIQSGSRNCDSATSKKSLEILLEGSSGWSGKEGSVCC